jgi:hypothetical protein
MCLTRLAERKDGVRREEKEKEKEGKPKGQA